MAQSHDPLRASQRKAMARVRPGRRPRGQDPRSQLGFPLALGSSGLATRIKDIKRHASIWNEVDRWNIQELGLSYRGEF